jgi:hypothetical protein
MHSRRSRYTVAACIVAVTATATVGCSSDGEPARYSKPVSESDALGSWASNCGSRFAIDPGGKATLESFPTAWDSSSGIPTKRFSGSGKWALDNDSAVGEYEGLQLNVNNTVYVLNYATVNGALGFSFMATYDDTGDVVFCQFSKVS